MESARTRPGSVDLLSDMPLIAYVASIDRMELLWISPQIEEFLHFPRERWSDNPRFWLELTHLEDRGRIIPCLEGSLKRAAFSIYMSSFMARNARGGG